MASRDVRTGVRGGSRGTATADPPPAGSTRPWGDLQHGIEHGELRLHYQPMMDLRDDTVVGVEALARWDRPGVGLLNPASFIEAAERTGQIIALGTWVARTACAAAVDLRGANGAPFSVSINVSARQLGDPGLIAMLEAALRDAGCVAAALVVEITETALMDDLEVAVTTLEAIKSLGVRLDLDDFGTGYSSLLYLRRFPVDRIKIDQSFVAGLGVHHTDTIIVASTIALAHAVGIQAIAEGVETPEQLELLRRMGCDLVQGYLLSRPLDADALTRWLATCEGHLRSLAGSAVADDPDWKFEPRDAVADRRDALADRRDAVAERRDAVADRRDRAADRREDAAGAQGPDAQGPRAPRQRSRAGRDGAVSAGERDRARRGREAASRDRDSAAARRLADENGRTDTGSGQ